MAKDTNKTEQNLELTRSVEIIESYMFATSKRSYSIYSERLLLKIVEIAQRQLVGANFKDGTSIGQVSFSALGDATIDIPIRSLLPEGSGNNYQQAKQAIMELMSSPYYVERPKMKRGVQVYDENGEPEYEMIGNQILNHCEVNVKPGYAVLEVNKNTWQAILDFSKGFRKFDLNAALRLKKPSSLRLFNLLSNQEQPITYTIEQLRTMWNLEGKYSDTSDFIRRTIEPAKQELDEKAPWSFDYEKNCAVSADVNKGRRGKKAVTSITFFPKRRISAVSTSTILKQFSPLDVMDRQTYEMLLNKFEFTPQGIKNNIVLFEGCRKCGVELFDFLQKIYPKASRAVSCQGYTIRALEAHLREVYGFEITKEKISFKL